MDDEGCLEQQQLAMLPMQLNATKPKLAKDNMGPLEDIQTNSAKEPLHHLQRRHP